MTQCAQGLARLAMDQAPSNAAGCINQRASCCGVRNQLGPDASACAAHVTQKHLHRFVTHLQRAPCSSQSGCVQEEQCRMNSSHRCPSATRVLACGAAATMLSRDAALSAVCSAPSAACNATGHAHDGHDIVTRAAPSTTHDARHCALRVSMQAVGASWGVQPRTVCGFIKPRICQPQAARGQTHTCNCDRRRRKWEPKLCQGQRASIVQRCAAGTLHRPGRSIMRLHNVPQDVHTRQDHARGADDDAHAMGDNGAAGKISRGHGFRSDAGIQGAEALAQQTVHICRVGSLQPHGRAAQCALGFQTY
jgi:hypothetical protein